MKIPTAAIEAAAANLAGYVFSMYDERKLARAAIEAAMPAILEAIAQEIITNGPALNYELNYDGTEDPRRAAYVEGHREAVDFVRGVTA